MCFACRTELIIFTVVIIAVCSYIAMLPATHVIFVKERSKDREWSSFTGQVHRVAGMVQCWVSYKLCFSLYVESSFCSFGV